MSPYADTYSEVTKRIIAALDRGVAPWKQPWRSFAAVNVRSGKPYRGINTLLLQLEARSDPRWGTFKAWKEVGGSVRRGEKGTRIVFWKRVAKKNPAEGEATHYALLRTYVVFNADQVDNAPPLPSEYRAEHVFDPYDAAEAVIANYPDPPRIAVGGDAAYYLPSEDAVQLPDRELFAASARWYGVAFHELIHSAGAEKRCGGLKPATFGSDPYAREELVAEVGAAMLAATVDLDISEDASAAYIDGWRSALSDDPRLIVSAAAEAQRRADHIRGVAFDEEAPKEEVASYARAA